MTDLTWTREKVDTAVKGCIVDLLEVDASMVMSDVSLRDLGADSLHFVDLTFRLERRFSIRLPPTFTIPDNRTVERFMRAVKSRLARDGRLIGGENLHENEVAK